MEFKVLEVLLMTSIYILGLIGFRMFINEITGRKVDFITVAIGVACVNILFA